MQLTHHTQHPVRFLSSSQNGLLCYGYDGEIYTVKEGQQSQKVAIRIVTDQTENELAHQIKIFRSYRNRRIPQWQGGSIYTSWRCIRHFY